MYTPHSVTIYNVWEDDNGVKTSQPTILRGVMLQAGLANSVNKRGSQDADKATLYIPYSVDASSTSGSQRSYVPPRQFISSEDKSSQWTIFSHGELSDHDCFFIKGEVNDTTHSYSELKKLYDDVYSITSVDFRDYGSNGMRHWQVGGK